MENYLKQLQQLAQQKKKENTEYFKKLRKKGKGNWKGKPYNLNEKCKLIKN